MNGVFGVERNERNPETPCRCSGFLHLSVRLNAHTRGHAEGGGNGGKDSDGDVQNFLPEFVLVHNLSYEL